MSSVALVVFSLVIVAILVALGVLAIRVRDLSRVVARLERPAVARAKRMAAPVRPAKAEVPPPPPPASPMEETFHDFYENNRWGNSESKSGAGSTLHYTAHLREHLPDVLREHGIRSMLDAPCGDFNWMKLVKFDDGFSYVGGDIVSRLVADNVAAYSAPGRAFRRFDIVTDEFPEVDLWFCRDLLFHLPNEPVMAALRNFAGSRVKFAMITSHINDGVRHRRFRNKDIPSPGMFRLLDLQARPYHFPSPLATIKDYVEGYPPRNVCLWTREQIAAALANGATRKPPEGPMLGL